MKNATYFTVAYILIIAYSVACALAGAFLADKANGDKDQTLFRICGRDGYCDTIPSCDIASIKCSEVKLRDGRFKCGSVSVQIVRDFDRHTGAPID